MAYGRNLFRHPASGSVRVTAPHENMQGDEYFLKIFNMSGQLQMLSRSATHKIVIDVHHLPAGIYSKHRSKRDNRKRQTNH